MVVFLLYCIMCILFVHKYYIILKGQYNMNLREAKQILIDNGYIIEGTRTDLESAKLSTIALTLYEKFIEIMPDNFNMLNCI